MRALIEEQALLEKKARRVPPDANVGINLLFVRRLARLTKLSYTRWSVLWSVLWVPVQVTQLALFVYGGTATGGIASAILEGDKEALCYAVNTAVTSAIAWNWRNSLCSYVHTRYFKNAAFYKLICFDQEIDNPDQRITDDVNKFADSYATQLTSSVAAPFQVAYMSYLTIDTIGWYTPLICLAYFLLGFVVNRALMTRLSSLIFRQDKLEGDFRFSHLRVRNCAESIGLYRASEKERKNNEERLRAAQKNKKRVIWWTLALNISANLTQYLAMVFPYLVLSLPLFYIPPFTSPTALYVTEAEIQCASLLISYTTLLSTAPGWSNVAGYTARISSMLSKLEELEKRFAHVKIRDFDDDEEEDIVGEEEEEGAKRKKAKGSIVPEKVEDAVSRLEKGVYKDMGTMSPLGFTDVTLYTPDMIPLMENITFQIRPGVNMVIMGPNGCGKSTILRTINGLWPFYKGEVTKPTHLRDIFYLSQTPYLFPGTLLDQITYPTILNKKDREQGEVSEKRANDALELVGLSHLHEKETEEANDVFTGKCMVNWPNVLSPGQQQLLCFARLFYHCPRYAILDESSSAMTEEMEQKMYEECLKKEITFISVGHRSSLKQYHNLLFQIDKNKNFSISPLPNTAYYSTSGIKA